MVTEEWVKGQKRIGTGIAELDGFLEGGFLGNTVTAVAGESGTGKTAFSLQFLLEGLKEGEQTLYISTDSCLPDEIIKEALRWGWHQFKEHLEKNFFCLSIAGTDFKDIIDHHLSKLIDAKQKHGIALRVAIDPINPILWVEEDKDRIIRRDMVIKLFSVLRKIGASLVTVELTGDISDATDISAQIPIYLACNMVHLKKSAIGGDLSRSMEILKLRGIPYTRQVYPIELETGEGIRLEPS